MRTNNRKKNPVIMITGATAGVGRATARLFAENGARIGLIARDPKRLEETKNDIEGRGGKGLCLPLDVVESEKIDAAATQLEETFGPIDFWINNAMVTVVSEVKDMRPDEYERVTAVCYLGYVYGTLAALKRMWERDQGQIIQVGSALAYRAIPLQSAYCGAKHAIQGFTESLRSELIHNKKNINVSMIQMPALNTPQFNWCKTRMRCQPQPVPPIYQPEVAARAVYWAAYHNCREITVGGKNILIVWLNKFLPGWGDTYLAKTGYQSQQTDQMVRQERKDNLWQPVEGGYAARGDFSRRASDISKTFWIRTRINWYWAGAVLLLIIIICVI